MTDTYAPDVQYYGPEEQRYLFERALCPKCRIATRMIDVSTASLAAVNCTACDNTWVLAAKDYELTELDPMQIDAAIERAKNIANARGDRT